MKCGCIECLRIILVVLNFLLVLIGLFILGFSVYCYLEPATSDSLAGFTRLQNVYLLLYVAMAVGSITLITALFGCCGAYHESQCLLAAYFTILLIIFITQSAAATVGFFYRDELFARVNGRMHEAIEEYSIAAEQRVIPTVFMDNIQRTLQCCGVDGYHNYQKSIPTSCCDPVRSSCYGPRFQPSEVYQEGCRDKFKEAWREKLTVIFIILVSITAFEISCILLSIVMCCSVRQSYSDYYGVDYAITS